jgi:hypothetical protein
MVNPNNWYQRKVRPGVAAVAEGALVVAGGVMAFVGSSGGEVAGPCVGLCVVAGGSRRCGSGSCVGPAESVVLDGVCRRRGRACVAWRLASGPFVGLGMEAFVRRGRVAPRPKEEASGPCVDPARRRLCARGRVSSREGSCVGARRDSIDVKCIVEAKNKPDGNKSLYLVFVGVVFLSILDCF